MIETIGIVGGGQLGRMMTPPAHELGVRVFVTDPVENCPAAQVGAEQVAVAPLNSTEAIDSLAGRVDVLTWEIEHIPASHLAQIARAHDIRVEPSPESLIIIQDKYIQKSFLRDNHILVAPFAETVEEARELLGAGPFIVKSRKGGYDGRGNLVVDELDETRITDFFGDKAVYIEQVVGFSEELSIIAARDKAGTVATYPVVQTIHEQNICHTVLAPAPVEVSISQQAEQLAAQVMSVMKGAGVFAIEMFVVNGMVMVNEIAPRVHNSGHLTIEACATSQFEQHIRAISGMPLGSTKLQVPAAAMVNILGRQEGRLTRGGLEEALEIGDVHVHFYGKDPKRMRKIGHVTALAATLDEARKKAELARRLLHD